MADAPRRVTHPSCKWGFRTGTSSSSSNKSGMLTHPSVTIKAVNNGVRQGRRFHHSQGKEHREWVQSSKFIFRVRTEALLQAEIWGRKKEICRIKSAAQEWPCLSLSQLQSCKAVGKLLTWSFVVNLWILGFYEMMTSAPACSFGLLEGVRLQRLSFFFFLEPKVTAGVGQWLVAVPLSLSQYSLAKAASKCLLHVT